MIAESLGGAEVPHYYMDASRNEDDPHTMVGEAFDHGQDGIYDLNADLADSPADNVAVRGRDQSAGGEGKGYMETADAARRLYP